LTTALSRSTGVMRCDEAGEGVCGVALHAGQHVLVDGHRERRRRMPETSLTTFNGTPCFNISVAWVWRRSCSRIAGTPATCWSRATVCESVCGWTGSPSGRVNTAPSVAAGPRSGLLHGRLMVVVTDHAACSSRAGSGVKASSNATGVSLPRARCRRCRL
jgi:hypothetical protein